MSFLSSLFCLSFCLAAGVSEKYSLPSRVVTKGDGCQRRPKPEGRKFRVDRLRVQRQRPNKQQQQKKETNKIEAHENKGKDATFEGEKSVPFLRGTFLLLQRLGCLEERGGGGSRRKGRTKSSQNCLASRRKERKQAEWKRRQEEAKRKRRGSKGERKEGRERLGPNICSPPLYHTEGIYAHRMLLPSLVVLYSMLTRKGNKKNTFPKNDVEGKENQSESTNGERKQSYKWDIFC